MGLAFMDLCYEEVVKQARVLLNRSWNLTGLTKRLINKYFR